MLIRTRMIIRRAIRMILVFSWSFMGILGYLPDYGLSDIYHSIFAGVLPGSVPEGVPFMGREYHNVQ
jgi:hypothetical protein